MDHVVSADQRIVVLHREVGCKRLMTSTRRVAYSSKLNTAAGTREEDDRNVTFSLFALRSLRLGLKLHPCYIRGLSNSRSRLLPVQIGMTQSTSTTLGLVDQERSALLMHYGRTT